MQRRQTIAVAGGELLGAAFAFVGQLLGTAGEREGGDGERRERMKSVLAECMEKTDTGGLKMTVQFPDSAALDSLAAVLSRIVDRAGAAVGK